MAQNHKSNCKLKKNKTKIIIIVIINKGHSSVLHISPDTAGLFSCINCMLVQIKRSPGLCASIGLQPKINVHSRV